MVKTGYARRLLAVAQTVRRPPTRKHYQERLVTLVRCVAKGVYPGRCTPRGRRPWRGNFDPERKNPGLSTDSPRLDSIEDFIQHVQVPPQLSWQLRVMVLETKIFTLGRRAYEMTVNRKFSPKYKLEYREWAAFLSTPEGTEVREIEDRPPDYWLQHDREPDLLVIKPELRRNPLPDEQGRPYPALLREWWEHGYVEAQIIDSLGKRTRCQYWQLARHVQIQRCSKMFKDIRNWALQAEILKAELCLYQLGQETAALQKLWASGKWQWAIMKRHWDEFESREERWRRIKTQFKERARMAGKAPQVAS